uniref:Uncharacterized protein n=1 Tax=Prototheca wickerhamii TaxID=3111 RepID=Q35693_PROWI|nr:hypothetical protein [Prototheca wickerhamii]AAD12653.1 unknown [Prototheca wickerhamii]
MSTLLKLNETALMSKMSYHYEELRYRIFYIMYSLFTALITCYYYQLELMYLLSRPFLQLHQTLQSTDISEALSTTFKLCIYVSLGICIFTYIYQYWSFIIPSRYYFERKKITFFIVLLLMILSIETYIIYFGIFPKICELFSSFQIYVDTSSTTYNQMNEIHKPLKIIEMSPRIESTVVSSIRIYILLCIIFQIPLIFILLFYFNYCNCFSICRYRKPFFFVLFVFQQQYLHLI